MATTQQEVKALKQDISDLKSALKEQLDDNSYNGASSTTFTREELKQMANRAGKGLRNFMDGKKEQLGNAKTACEGTIKSRPFTSTAVAFAGGLALAAILKRR